jgi:hypothetical protein
VLRNDLWGTKWGTYDVEIYEIEDTYVAMDFNTAWSIFVQRLDIITRHNYCT